MHKYYLLITSLFISFLISNLYGENGTLNIDTEKEYSVWKYAKIFEDKNNNLDFNEIFNDKYQFVKPKQIIPNFGYTRSAIWITFEIRNNMKDIIKWAMEFKYANLNYVDFYLVDKADGKIVKTVKTGNMRPLTTRDYYHQRIIFLLSLTQGKEYKVYLRVKNIPSISLPIYLNSFSNMEKKVLKFNIFIGIILGILLLLFISNVSIIFSLKDKTYLYFSLLLIFILMFNLTYSGIAYLYIWPNLPNWNLYANPFFISFIVLFFLKFTQHFLQFKKNHMFWNKVLTVFSSLWAIITFLIPFRFVSYQYLMKFLLSFLIISVSLALFIGFKSYSEKYRPAKSYIISLLLIIITAINLALIRLAVLPTWDFGENGYMIGIVFLSWLMSRALTDRIKLLQQEKENARFDLIKSNEKYRNIFNNITDIYIELDLEGKIIEISPSVHNIFKIKREDILFKNMADFYSDLSSIKKLISLITRQRYVKNYELKLTDINNVSHYFSINAVLLKGDTKKNKKIAGIIRDETENRKLQEQLFQAQKMDSMGRLAAGIAHDFNNLLTVIKGYSEIALSKLTPEQSVYKEISVIHSAGEKAENLTRQILAFSRKQIFRPKILDINKTISDLDKMIRRIIGEDIDFYISLMPDLPKIKADPGQIEQILINIIINAKDALNAKTNKASEKKITIETGKIKLGNAGNDLCDITKDECYLYFSISDTGVGIPDEIKQNIFDPFFTTKEKGKGTGLGLATVYGIVTQNKGKITVYSEINKGTVFKIYWPIAEEELEYEEINKINKATISGSETILLVEDEESVRDFANIAMQKLGYTVVPASNGAEALEIINKNEHHLDLVITDLIMPEMGGAEMSGHLQKIAPELKILFVSGYSDDHIIHSGKLDKDIDFLHKPYSINDLAAKVREILDRKP